MKYFCKDNNNDLFCFLGFVALIVGGSDGATVEVYSPNGDCQHQLPNIPSVSGYLRYPTPAYIDGKLLSCGGHPESSATVRIISRIKFLFVLITCYKKLNKWFERLSCMAPNLFSANYFLIF